MQLLKSIRIRHMLLWLFAGFIIAIHLCLLTPATDAGIFLYGSMLTTKGYLPYLHLWDDKPPLIYIIGCVGFLLKQHPFLGIRILEIGIFLCNLLLLAGICRALGKKPMASQFAFCVLYLIFWDQGFLTETFNVPLVLLAAYLFIRRSRYFEYILPLCFLLCFLLKQNSIVVIGMIGILDLFSNYRKHNRWGKAGRYAIATIIYTLVTYVLLLKSGVWKDFLDQAFDYNFRYIHQYGMIDLLVRHISQHSYISIIGLAFALAFFIVILLLLVRFKRQYRNGKIFTPADKLTLWSIVIYFVALYPTYLSGRSYPHYFLMLIVPASFILGTLAEEKLLVRFGLLLLMIVGMTANIRLILNDRKLHDERTTIVKFIVDNTSKNERIYVEGMNDAWLYIFSNRLSNTKFIYDIPFYEGPGYSSKYEKELEDDFSINPPKLIIIDKEIANIVDERNFYYQTINKSLEKYSKIYENKMFLIYKRFS